MPGSDALPSTAIMPCCEWTNSNRSAICRHVFCIAQLEVTTNTLRTAGSEPVDNLLSVVLLLEHQLSFIVGPPKLIIPSLCFESLVA